MLTTIFGAILLFLWHLVWGELLWPLLRWLVSRLLRHFGFDLPMAPKPYFLGDKP